MPVLLVAATGGHLAQLDRLAPRIVGVDEEAIWVTFDTPQSRSLLRDRPHEFVPYSGPRDTRAVVANFAVATRIIRRVRPSAVISTGNSVAVSFLPVARALRIPSAYIESAARADGPSMTGRILRWTPGVQLFAQYPGWARGPWRHVASVFDQFTVSPVAKTREIRRILVSLGTIGYDFRRVIERLLAVVPTECDVVWQVGSTDTTGLSIAARSTMSSAELGAEMRAADLVIAHAGIGSALAAMDAGHSPVLVARERAYREHVDDHQLQIATALDRLGLAVGRTVDTLTTADLVVAARRSVVSRTDLSEIVIPGT
jgi:UDP-N-acetylglucosamine transferase subunit ALG13